MDLLPGASLQCLLRPEHETLLANSSSAYTSLLEAQRLSSQGLKDSATGFGVKPGLFTTEQPS